MEVSMKRKALVMMLMIILVATQVECITPSQEFAPIKRNKIACEMKCYLLCLGNPLGEVFDACVRDCEKNECGKNKNIVMILKSTMVSRFIYSLHLLLS
jgi:hypothetical protein